MLRAVSLSSFFFFNDTATTEIYTLSLHDALPIYVVDEQLQPVPLGVPGEIVFSGVCVGRGYINDPERTQGAFLQDPLRPGQRLYRSGDYGRGLPDGKLEFLGRRDSQVKISGFRIEIGEIENQLLKLPGVREGAVAVTEGAGQNKHLVAFCSGDRPPNPGVMRDRLARALPGYMVPSGFGGRSPERSEEHTSELQSRLHLVCRLLLEKKKKIK